MIIPATEHAGLPAVVERRPPVTQRESTPLPAFQTAKSQFSIKQFAKRHWRYLVACALVSAGAAAGAATMFGSQTYTLTASLLCNGSTEVIQQGGVDIASLQQIFSSRQALLDVIKKYELHCTPKYLNKQLEAKVPHNSKSVVITFKWRDLEQGKQVLNDLIDNCVKQSAQIEQAYFDRVSQHATHQAELARSMLAESEKSLLAFVEKENILDVEQDISAAKTRQDEVESALREQSLNLSTVVYDPPLASSIAAAVAATRSKMSTLQNELQARRAELERIKNLRAEMLRLQGNLEVAKAAREKTEEGLHEMQTAEVYKHGSISLLQPAELSIDPFSSTFSKLFAGVFLGLSLTLSVVPMLADYHTSRPSRLTSAAARLNLPVLAQYAKASSTRAGGEPREVNSDAEFARLLSLRLQQFAYMPGSVILLTGLNSVSIPKGSLVALAECLGQRDHRVLCMVLDGGGTQAGWHREFHSRISVPAETDKTYHGVAEYLARDNFDLHDVTQLSQFPGVDFVLRGDVPLPREAFGMRRMTKMIEQARCEYSMVVIAAPGIEHAIDIEMLAARSDGVVLHAFGSSEMSSSALSEVHHLIDLGAPVLGVIG